MPVSNLLMHLAAYGKRRCVSIPQRVLLAVVGGYLLASGAAAVAARLLSEAMPRVESVVLMAMLAFIAYLALLLWAFTERRLVRIWIVLGGGWALSYGLNHWLALPAAAVGH